MPTTKLFDITLGDINFLLDQMRHTILVVRYDGAGHPVYGYRDASDPSGTGYHELGLFGTFDPLQVNGPDGLPLYQGARDAAGLRIVSGLFNNLTGTMDSPYAWMWGSVNEPFPRLTAPEYNHYVNQVLADHPEVAAYVSAHPTPATVPPLTPMADSSTLYADPMITVVDYTPRMITQTISTSYGGHNPAAALGTVPLTGTDQASAVMSPGEVLVITIGGTATVFEFNNGSIPNSGNLIFIDVSSGHTIDDALAAIQAGLRAHGGDVNATVSLVGGNVNVALGDPTLGDLTISDFAGLGLDGTFSPTPNSNSALLRVGAATDTFTETVTYADGHTAQIEETIVRNQNTLPGDPSTSGIFTLFGQFFDHGLDFIDKGGQGSKIVIPLSSTDPLYRAPGTLGASDPGNTAMTISRATPDGYTVTDLHGRELSIAGADRTWGTSDDLKAPGADGVYGTGDDVLGAMVKPAAANYTNHTSPYIDQSQSYGSDTQITTLLRAWVKDPNYSGPAGGPNQGEFRAGAELFDGHQIKAYTTPTFGTTTRTVPTLNELRGELADTHRDDFTWDDINNYRARDQYGHVIDTNGADVGGNIYTGQALLLDMNPHFDLGHLNPNDNDSSTTWDSAVTGKVNSAIGTLNASLSGGSTFGLVGGQLTLHLASAQNTANGPMPAGDYSGAQAMGLWVNFANFSITAADTIYNAVGELLMASVGDHYVAGDGRANENFGLTALHHVFHENHNVQLVNLENMILSSADVTARHGYQLAVSDGNNGFFTDAQGNYTLSDHTTISWDPDKMFEATKLINEMEYQHVAIDQYARLVTPDLPEFVTYDSNINADISLEYSQSAFRFGHSQLRETIDAIDPNGMVTKMALSGAFLNPTQFAAIGASDILRGMSQQVSNEVDEFLTPAMQQSLLGQALDLGAINIARARDVGIPTLNETRKALHDALVAERAADPTTPHHTNLIVDALNPYTSWADFGSQMLHPDSLVNFIAAYSFDGNLAKAQAIIGLDAGTISENTADAQGFSLEQAINFLHDSLTASDPLVTAAHAYNDIDLWIGGLAEVHVFTGQLGTTFNAIFEDQMERLMDGDRFYYLYRLGLALPIDTDLDHAIATEQFKDIIERTTGVQHLNGDVMGYSDSYIELGKTFVPGANLLAYKGEQIHNVTGALVTANQGDIKYELVNGSWTPIQADEKTAHNYGQQVADYAAQHQGQEIGIYSGSGGGTLGNGGFITKSNADLGLVNQLYIRDARPDLGENDDGTPNQGFNAHEVLSGTDYNDYIQAGNGDDTAYGDKGDDVLDGQGGADHLYGGDGQDVLYGGDIEDFLDGGAGDDIVYAGTSAGALDVVIGGAGNDKLYGEAGIDEIYGGAGDDYIDAGGDTDLAFGDGGNDIMFGGDGPDELRGGLGDDLLSGGSGPDMLKGEDGDDIMFGGLGQSAQNGDSDELLGGTGFDLAAYSDLNVALDVPADLRNQNLTAAGGSPPFNPFNQLIVDSEGLIGSKFNDKLIGDDGNNWLVGGGGADTFNTNVANTDGTVGSGGNDVIIGDSIRLDTLIGHYGQYTNGFDGNGNAMHGYTGPLTAGLLGTVDPTGQIFAKHFTELLQSERNKDFVLGQDTGSAATTAANADVATFTGKYSEYTITAITYNAGNADGNIVAYRVTDHGGLNPDGTARASDGTDLLVGIEKLQFSDRTLSLINAPPTLDLYTVDNGNYRDEFSTASFSNSNGTQSWTAPWVESNDNGAVTTGQIQIDAGGGGGTNQLRFVGGAGSGFDGASIQRVVNLAGATSATLSYTFDQNNIDPGETVTVLFAADGTNFTQTIQTITNTSGNGGGSGSTSIALTGPFTANSAIKFVASAINSANEDVRIDNVNIAFTKPVNDGTNNYTATFTEDGNAVAIASGPSIADDGTIIHSAKIVLTNAHAGDSFSLGSHPGIAASTDNTVAGQITVNLTNDASLAAYQAAIQAITFSNNSQNPDPADRIIHVTVNDGLVDSNVATATIHVIPVNDAPNANNDTIVTNISGAGAVIIPDWALLANDTDVDGPSLAVSAVSNPSSATATHASGAVTFNDTGTSATSNGGNNNGTMGSFVYQASDNAVPTAATATATATVTRDAGNIDAGNGNQIIVGDATGSTIDPGTGNDIVFAGAGADTIQWNANTGATDGHDFVDGGTTALDVNGRDTTPDTFVVNGNTSNETFIVYARLDAEAAGITGLNANTEIVITRNGLVIAELDNVEEITVNTGTGPDSTSSVHVLGNFNGTSLAFNTITINGGEGNDTVDITGLTSDHRIVFHGGGGNNQVIGDLRPQDVVDNGTPSIPPGDDPGSQPPGNGSGDDTTPAHIGTSADDVLIGGATDDILSGVGGDDLILGNGGADTLKGGDGDDLIKGGAGDDVAFGNAGDDDVFGGAGQDMLFGDQGNDRLFGDDGNDVIEGGAGNDTVFAGSGDDRVLATVNDGDDIYWGEDGQDTVDYSAYTADLKVDLGNGLLQHGSVTSTQSGNDTIFGFENFIGGSGNDTITASAAVNVMDGGPGNDTYVFNSAGDANGDVIKGFQPGDKIDLSGIDANIGSGGNQSFVLFAGTGFTAAGQLMVTHEVQNGVDHTIVAGNINNDAVADFKIDVVGNHTLTPSDFHGVN